MMMMSLCVQCVLDLEVAGFSLMIGLGIFAFIASILCSAAFFHNAVDIPPKTGALVVNLGDFFQLISNDKFKSSKHRVLTNLVGPRISVSCFVSTHLQPFNRVYGPIKELLSDDNPALYRETLVRDYVADYFLKELGSPALSYVRL